MSEILKKISREWRLFRSDPPSERFQRHYARAKSTRSTVGVIVRLIVGPILILVGVLLWFLPGPGWLCIFAGLTTLAGGSQPVARSLDRFEVFVRRLLRRVHVWWTSSRPLAQLLVVAVGLTALGGLGCAAYLILA